MLLRARELTFDLTGKNWHATLGVNIGQWFFVRSHHDYVGTFLVTCFAVACASNGPVYVPPTPSDDYFQFRVSEGHMPRPGECRVWYPDVPPDRQSPPGRCIELERQVPPGAILVRG